jgi:short-subunit dehydrogenase
MVYTAPMPVPDRPRAVVTGAASGLGRAFALEIARRGGATLVADRDTAGSDETVRLVREAGGRAEAVACDVTRVADVERLASEAERALGGVDIVVNNAGVAVAGPVGKVPLDDWRWIIDINLFGVIHGCHVFVPYFRNRGSGHVLNVASAAGLISAPEMAPYNVTKAGVVALSETLWGELDGTGVGVTVLCPTFFRTNIGKSARSHVEGDAMSALDALMDRAKVQAADVARYALDAAAANKLYALPHGDGRWGWRVKRAAPELFKRVAARVAKRMKTHPQ